MAGDGGMEYGMCTLITGERDFSSLVGVTAHELAHSWFHFVLATNESQHEWMDEGFTEYFGTEAESNIVGLDKNLYKKNLYRRLLVISDPNIVKLLPKRQLFHLL